MKQLAYIFLTLSLINLLSCSNDLLDQKPLNSYTELTAYSDLKLTEMLLNTKYRNALEKFPWILAYGAASDEAYSNWNWFGEVNVVTAAITPDLTFMDGRDDFAGWSGRYKDIRDLNNFLLNIDKVPGDEAWRNRQKGEATFLRAYLYADLVKRYGGVVLIKNTPDPYGNTKEKRSDYDECIQFIISELDTAASLLPSRYENEQLGRITKGAALAIKARVLLYWASARNNPGNDMSRWSAAANAAKAVIDLNDKGKVYSLFDPKDYGSIFTTDFNAETILCRMQSKDFDEDNNVDLINSPSGYLGWSTFEPTQDIVDQFEMANGKMIGEPGSGYDATKPYLGRDKRFYANVIYDGGPYRGREVEHWITKDDKGAIVSGGLDSQKGPYEYWNYSKSGYNMRKYTQESRKIDLPSAVKPSLVRLTEMYLNYAEAENMLGNDAVAREYVNYIRQRNCVGLPPIPNSVAGIALRDKIRHERMIELMWEGHRFFDVRRWNILTETGSKPAHGIEITKKGDDSKIYNVFVLQERKAEEKNYLMPIPKIELLKVDLQQNPGY